MNLRVWENLPVAMWLRLCVYVYVYMCGCVYMCVNVWTCVPVHGAQVFQVVSTSCDQRWSLYRGCVVWRCNAVLGDRSKQWCQISPSHRPLCSWRVVLNCSGESKQFFGKSTWMSAIILDEKAVLATQYPGWNSWCLGLVVTLSYETCRDEYTYVSLGINCLAGNGQLEFIDSGVNAMEWWRFCDHSQGLTAQWSHLAPGPDPSSWKCIKSLSSPCFSERHTW